MKANSAQKTVNARPVADSRREHGKAELQRAVRDAVAAAPPLTAEQRSRIAQLLVSDGDH